MCLSEINPAKTLQLPFRSTFLFLVGFLVAPKIIYSTYSQPKKCIKYKYIYIRKFFRFSCGKPTLHHPTTSTSLHVRCFLISGQRELHEPPGPWQLTTNMATYPLPCRKQLGSPSKQKRKFLRKTHPLSVAFYLVRQLDTFRDKASPWQFNPNFFAQIRETCSTRNSADFEPQLWRHHQICTCLWHRAKPRYRKKSVLAEWKTDSTISKQLCMTMKSYVFCCFHTFPAFFQKQKIPSTASMIRSWNVSWRCWKSRTHTMKPPTSHFGVGSEGWWSEAWWWDIIIRKNSYVCIHQENVKK